MVIRDYVKPSSAGRGALDAWSPSLASLDVHLGSGPMNRAFFFLSKGSSRVAGDAAYASLLPGGMDGIGLDKAAQIWYRALTVYLTPSSRNQDARNAVLDAAIDLYGPGGPEARAVAAAFAAIGVGSAAAPAPPDATTLDLTATLAGPQLTLTATSPGNLQLHRLRHAPGLRQPGLPGRRLRAGAPGGPGRPQWRRRGG